MFGRKKKKQEEPKSYLRCPYCGHAPIIESLADRKLMKRVHGGYAITLKGLLAVKVWRLHLFLFHHGEYKYFRRKK